MATQDRLPTSDTYNGWTASAGNRYECVDDPIGTPDDDTTYIYRADSAGQQNFGFAAFDITSTSVTKVSVFARVRKVTEDASNCLVGVRIEDDGFNSGTALVLTTSYQDFTRDWLTNPHTGVAWLEGDLERTTGDDLDGIHIWCDIGAGQTVRCTQMYITADYVTAGAATGAVLRSLSSASSMSSTSAVMPYDMNIKRRRKIREE